VVRGRISVGYPFSPAKAPPKSGPMHRGAFGPTRYLTRPCLVAPLGSRIQHLCTCPSSGKVPMNKRSMLLVAIHLSVGQYVERVDPVLSPISLRKSAPGGTFPVVEINWEVEQGRKTHVSGHPPATAVIRSYLWTPEASLPVRATNSLYVPSYTRGGWAGTSSPLPPSLPGRNSKTRLLSPFRNVRS